MFWLKKLIALSTYPLGPIFLVGAVGLFLLWRRPQNPWGGRLALMAALLVVLVTAGPLGNLLIRPLESVHPPILDVRAVERPVEYVVVLGGGLSAVDGPVTSQLNDSTAIRLLEGLRLMAHFEEATLVVSGAATGQRRTTAEAMAQVADELGIDPERLLAHDQARDTAEEARALSEVAPDGANILLVTEASHMPRAMMLFERQGFEPVAAPTYYRATQGGGWPSARNLRKVERALYEYLALIWVRLGGS